jgi:hypothetical protein
MQHPREMKANSELRVVVPVIWKCEKRKVFSHREHRFPLGEGQPKMRIALKTEARIQDGPDRIALTRNGIGLRRL